MNNAQQEQAKRDLRMQIGRLRRQLGARVRQAKKQTRRVQSWRTYVEDYPGSAIMAALGVGLTLSAGLRAGRFTRWIGLRLIRRSLRTVAASFWRQLQEIWLAAAPK
jgi:hypothetical protein